MIGLLLVFASQRIVHTEMKWQSSLYSRETLKGDLRQSDKAMYAINKGPSQERTGTVQGRKGKKGTNTSYQSIQTSNREKGHAPHFAQQHESACHDVHFHWARWRITPRECVHADNLRTFHITCIGRSPELDLHQDNSKIRLQDHHHSRSFNGK